MRQFVIGFAIESDMFAGCEASFKRHFRLDRVFVLPFIGAFGLVHAHGDFIGDEIGQVRKVLQVYWPNLLKLFRNSGGPVTLEPARRRAALEDSLRCAR